MSILLRPSLRITSPPSVFDLKKPGSFVCQSCRNARLLKRPKRPYTFTQLITLSDGSAFTIRTTSPTPVYRSTKDARNTLLWNPSSRELMNVEDDDAGRLSGFRARFGRSYDTAKKIESLEEEDAAAAVEEASEERPKPPTSNEFGLDDNDFDDEDDENILDIISSYGRKVDGGEGKGGGKK